MGGPSKQEQGQQTQSWTNLNSLFKSASDTASSFGAKGSSTLNDVTKYFKTLLSGDRAATAKAEAPGIASIQSGAEAAKKQRADMGTGRTGGAVAENQQSEDRTRSQIDSLISSAAPGAATSLTGIGESDINAMLSALGLGTNAAATVGGQTTSDIVAQRQASADMWSSLIGGAAKVGAAFIPVPKPS